MNQHPSLADEKQALLAKMQASRVAYRRMLLGAETQEYATVEEIRPANSFPRSHTVRFIRDHPYLIGLAAAVIVAASIPRSRQTVTQALRQTARKGRNASAMMSMAVRNQQRIRLVIGFAATALRFIQQRRQR